MKQTLVIIALTVAATLAGCNRDDQITLYEASFLDKATYVEVYFINHCFPTNPTTCTINKANSEVYNPLFDNTGKLINCTIANAENWTRSYSDGISTVSVVDGVGRPSRQDISEFIKWRYIGKWHSRWLLFLDFLGWIGIIDRSHGEV